LSEAARNDPSNDQLAREAAAAETGIGDLWSTTDASRAIPHYLAALERIASLPHENRGVLADRRSLRSKLGQVHAFTFDFAKADEHYREAESAAAALLRLDPENATLRSIA
jgi:hypothetical protein